MYSFQGMQSNMGMQRQISVPDNNFQPQQNQPTDMNQMYQRQLSTPGNDYQSQLMMQQFQGQMQNPNPNQFQGQGPF